MTHVKVIRRVKNRKCGWSRISEGKLGCKVQSLPIVWKVIDFALAFLSFGNDLQWLVRCLLSLKTTWNDAAPVILANHDSDDKLLHRQLRASTYSVYNKLLLTQGLWWLVTYITEHLVQHVATGPVVSQSAALATDCYKTNHCFR